MDRIYRGLPFFFFQHEPVPFCWVEVMVSSRLGVLVTRKGLFLCLVNGGLSFGLLCLRFRCFDLPFQGVQIVLVEYEFAMFLPALACLCQILIGTSIGAREQEK